jgi:hypothetical protein
MNYSLFLLWLVSLAQITSGTALPADTQIFTITLKEGQSERVVNAAVKAEGKFISEFDKANRPSQVELYFDTPWAPSDPERVLSQKIREIEPEPRIKRDKRYKESGFEQMETPKGPIWVSSETIARDKRARELQASLQVEQETLAAAHASQAESGAGTTAAPGFARLWGGHIMVLVTALVVVVVAIKTCF